MKYHIDTKASLSKISEMKKWCVKNAPGTMFTPGTLIFDIKNGVIQKEEQIMIFSFNKEDYLNEFRTEFKEYV